MSTPTETDVAAQAGRLWKAWEAAGRHGEPDIRVLATTKPTPELLEEWTRAGVTEAIWGLPDRSAEEVESFIDRHATRLGLS